MSGVENIIKEVIVLSDLIQKQDFRTCFITHFAERVKELNNVSIKIDINILQKLQVKLLEPLLIHLKTVANSNDKCLLIQCINQVLKLTLINNINEFFDVYITVFFQIFRDENPTRSISEELKESVLNCCCYLIKNSSQDVLEKVYCEKFGAKLSLGIFISVNIIKEDRSIKLRIAALDFLLVITKFETNPEYSQEIFNKIGDLFMLYLPGILAPLLEVILREETQHHLITVKALLCWGHVLCVVMRDSPQLKYPSDTEIMQQWLNFQKTSQDTILDVNKGLKEKKRTQLWLKSVALTLHPLIVKLSDVRKHSHPKCRLALTKIMTGLMKTCINNMQNCLPLIVDILVSSAVDENTEVSLAAKAALATFEAECDKRKVGIFASVIEENLYSVINKLPKMVRSGNEQLTLVSLKSFSGYLKILGRLDRLKPLLSLSSSLTKIVSVLKISFELETYAELCQQDFSTWETKSHIWNKPWKRFRYFADHSIQSQIQDICQKLGEFGDSETIFDFLLDSYKEDCSSRKEILLILNELILGSKQIENHVLNQLLDFYLESKNIYLPLQVNNVNCNNLKEAQTNIIKVALIMEGIGTLAKRVGIVFQDHLLKTLYYVLEKMGTSYLIIRECATVAATEIANSCGLEGNVKLLIQKNVDYLTYHISVKFNRNDKSAFDVVSVLIKNSPFESMPHLEEIISSVLKSSSRSLDSPHILSYLQLLKTFIVCVKKQIKNKNEFSTTIKRPQELNVDELKKILEKGTGKLEDEEYEKETQEEEQRSENEEEVLLPQEPEKSELPKHLKLTLAVAKHCLHYLASRDKEKKIIVLEILNDCVWALSDRENDLLPLVHQIWSPLVTRFELITEPLIINRSFKLLCTLSFTSKDFIRARTLKNVLPALESFLVKQAGKSKLKNSASDYFFTQNFKLQRDLLENLGKLTASLGLFERQTDLVVESGLPYLSSYQPRELQEKCKILFDDLKAYDSHMVKYKLKPLLKEAEFAKNVEIILDELK